MGKSKDDGRKATNGNDVLVGTAKNDNLSGKKGDDQISGLAGNDKLKGDQGNDLLDGGSGNDRLYGGKGDDRILGGSGNDVLYGDGGKSHGWGWDKFCWWTPKSDDDDYLDGGAGSDRIYAGRGDDVAVYSMAGNLGAGFKNICTHDEYDGGKGYDTLVLQLTYGEARLTSVQQDIAAFQDFLARRADARSDHGREFEFRSFNLDVSNFEALRVDLVNTGPTANNDAGATNEDTLFVMAASALLANDTDPDHLDVLSLTGVSATSALGATLTLAASGQLTYDPRGAIALQRLAQDVTAIDSFGYTIADLGGASATGTVKVTVTGVNDTPVAVDDTASTDEDTVLALNVVLANDTDVDVGDTLSAAPAFFDPRAAFQYLAVGESAITTLEYTVSDNHDASDTGTVTITVTGVNDGPDAVDDTATPVAPPVESLFGFESTDLDGYSLPAFTFYPFGFGVGNSPMAYIFTGGDSEADGADGALRRTDGHNFALRSLDVAAYFNLHPVTIVGYDDGTEVASLTVALGAAGPSNGLSGYTSLSFGAEWSSVDDVRFYADDNGDLTFIDNLRVAVPAAGNEDTAADIDVLGNDTDPDTSDELHVDTFDALSAMGAAVELNADGTFHYDPTTAIDVQALAAEEVAVDTFTYVVSDGHGGTDDATVRVNLTGVNDLPVAAEDAAGTDEDTAIDIDVLANDDDPDTSDVLEVDTLDTHSALGAAISVNADGTIHYDPTAAAAVQALGVDETATDTFEYTVSDGHGGSATAEVGVELTGVNDAPVAQDDDNLIVDLRGFEGASSPSNVGGYFLTGFNLLSSLGVNGSSMAYAQTSNDFDEDAADGALQRVDGQDFGLLSIDVAAYQFAHPVTIAGFDDGVLVASLTVGVGVAGPSNGSSGYTSLSFNSSWGSIDEVRFYADAVDGNTDFTFIDNLRVQVGIRGNEDTPIDLDVLANDSDPDAGDVLEVVEVSAGTLGALITINGDGTINYDATATEAAQLLAAGETATDTFTYRASDGHGGISDQATVTVHVVGVNDAPEALDESFDLDEDGVSSGNVLGNDVDVDSPTLSAVLFERPAHGTLDLDEDGAFLYTPDANFNGEDSFTYFASDGDLESNVATVRFAIAPVNDQPVAVDDAYNVNPDTGLTVVGPGVLANDTDADEDSLLAELAVGPEHGTLKFNADGSFSYTPEEGFDGEDSFAYSVSDGEAFLDLATVTLTINADNSPPIAADDKASTNEDATVSGNVLSAANGGLDTDADGDALTVTTTGDFTTLLGASVTLNQNGSFTYDPRGSATLQALNAGQSKVDSFGYSIDDGNGGTDSATVSVSVAGRDEASDGSGGGLGESFKGSEYFIRFEGTGFDSSHWLRLGSFETDIGTSVVGGSAGTRGRVVAQEVEGGLGSGAAIVDLSNALLSGKQLPAVHIAVMGPNPEDGTTQVLDTWRFANVQVTGLGTQADGEMTTNDLSFSFDEFGRSYGTGATEMGFDLKGGGGAQSAQPPSPVDLSPINLGDGLGVEADLQYFARFEGNGVTADWLRLDSFSMGLSRPTSGSLGQTKGRPTAEDTVLVLDSSKQVVELTQAMVLGTVLKGVEVEAYAPLFDGGMTLVDEFHFDNVLIAGVKSSGEATLESGGGEVNTASHAITLGLSKFTHSHIEYDPFGGGGGDSGVGFDFVSGKGSVISAPSPAEDAFDDPLGESFKGSEYFIRFEGTGFDSSHWLRLGSFETDIGTSVVGGSAGTRGRVVAQEVEGGLGSGAAIVDLSNALLSGKQLPAVHIAVMGPNPEDGTTQVLDTWRFANVQVTGLGTQADGEMTTNDLSFSFDEFGRSYGTGATEMGFDLKGGGGAQSAQPPSPVDLSPINLGDGLGVEADLQYFARFEGNGVTADWLRLDSFSMGLSRPTSGSLGQTKGRPTAEDTVLVLDSSKQVVELTQAMVLGTVLKGVEVEAYAPLFDGGMTLVDEFHFDNVLIAGVKSSGEATLESGGGEVNTASHAITLGLSKFTHSHIEYDPFGGGGGDSGVGFDFVSGKGSVISAPSPAEDAFDDPLGESFKGSEYFIRFEGTGFDSSHWLRLGSFETDIGTSVVGGSAGTRGRVVAQEVEGGLGSGAAIVDLSNALLSGKQLPAVHIAVMGPNPEDGTTQVLDTWRFANVQVTGLGTQADGEMTTNDLSFSFDEFGRSYGTGATEMGFDLKGGGGAQSAQPPSPVDLSPINLGDGLGVEADLQYFARFEGNGVTADWLRLDSFSMGLSRPTSGSLGQTKGRPTAEDTVLVLDSSKQVVELTQAMVLGTVLKGVEVEAYAPLFDGGMTLVDEFHFDNVLIAGVKSSGEATLESGGGEVNTASHAITLGLSKFTHSHIEYDPFGGGGGDSGVGFDFVSGKGSVISAPSPDADVF